MWRTMFRRILFLLACTALTHLPSRFACAAEPGNPLRVELVSETQGIQPGRPFLVALALHPPPGYHSYWKFPGIVGVSTSLKWELPQGWKAAPLIWPTPERVMMFQIKAQGFHGRRLLPVEITPPPNLAPGQSCELVAKAFWMCCGKDCNPGFQTFHLSMPVLISPPKKDPKWAPLFAEALAQVPTPKPGWKISAARSPSTIQIRVEAVSSAAKAQLPKIQEATFFTEDGLTDPNSIEKFVLLPNGFSLTLGISEFAPKPLPRTVNGVLQTPRGWLPETESSGMRISAPLVPLRGAQ
jgi:DsbC/DsbD-like thiol-disulfide interchange protein